MLLQLLTLLPAVLQVPDSLTSSMVDDVFFILKKCGARALGTGSIQCVCALLGQLNDMLANQYKAALQSRLAAGPSKLLASAPDLTGSASATDAAGRRFLCVSQACRWHVCLAEWGAAAPAIGADIARWVF